MTHSIEGRDWQRLFEAFSIEGEVAHRPNFAGYAEVVGTRLAYAFILLDAQKGLRTPTCEVAPEVENFPFTQWRKSHALTWAQMAAAMFHGSDALLLDLFPFCGNLIDRVPDVAVLLDKSRPALEWVSARFPKTLRSCGVGLPWREDAQAHVHTECGASMDELNADFCGPGELLLPYGIPVSCGPQPVNAIFGNLAWALGDAVIREMLSGGLMLDGVSADILCQRGFGRLIGVDFGKWLDRERSTYSLECVTSRQAGVPVGHYFGVNKLDRIAAIGPRSGAKEWTSIITPERDRVGSGIVVFRNRAGGRVVTFAAPSPEFLARTDCRRDLMHKMVSFLYAGRRRFPIVTGHPNMMPACFEGKGRRVLVIANGSTDPGVPVIHLPARATRSATATLLAPLAKPATVKLRPVAGSKAVTLTGKTKLPYLAYLVVEI